jgi:hypothetical protein
MRGRCLQPRTLVLEQRQQQILSESLKYQKVSESRYTRELRAYQGSSRGRQTKRGR